jgi:hypothetical protein
MTENMYLSRRTQVPIKLAMVAVWPLVTAFLLVTLLLIMISAWALIPFGNLRRKPDGVITMDFPSA